MTIFMGYSLRPASDWPWSSGGLDEHKDARHRRATREARGHLSRAVPESICGANRLEMIGFARDSSTRLKVPFGPAHNRASSLHESWAGAATPTAWAGEARRTP